MHDVTNASNHATQLRRCLADEVADVEPRHFLQQILAAARRCDTWLIALIAGLQLAVLIAALAWLARYDTPAAPPATTTTRLMEA